MVRVIVPATTANIGPGFDCLGIALNLYNNVLFKEIDKGLIIRGCAEKYKNENNLIYRSMLRAFNEIGYDYKGMEIVIESDIPESRGLGSSASCIVAGILGANEIGNGQLTRRDIFRLATEIEGHPDNIAPAIYGGMTAAIYNGRDLYSTNIKVHDDLNFYVLIPDFTLSTSESRSILPKEVSFKDATFNIGHTALMIASLVNGDRDLLKVSIKDKIHQDYRGSLIPEYNEIMGKLDKLPIEGAFLSGAGPSIIAISSRDSHELEQSIIDLISNLKNQWILKKLNIDYKGAIVGRE